MAIFTPTFIEYANLFGKFNFQIKQLLNLRIEGCLNFTACEPLNRQIQQFGRPGACNS